jgi:hypothetical protein
VQLPNALSRYSAITFAKLLGKQDNPNQQVTYLSVRWSPDGLHKTTKKVRRLVDFVVRAIAVVALYFFDFIMKTTTLIYT